MFNTLFGHQKASKCKKLIGRVQNRLKLVKDKRTSIARHMRNDVVSLMFEYPELALVRAEKLYNDLNLLSAYELLDGFCELVSLHVYCMLGNKDIHGEVNEAVSSLVFASARCGDIPELGGIKKFFTKRYGERFTMVALELLPGNRVNDQIKEKLSGEAVPKDLVQKLFDEIAREYCSTKADVIGIESASQLQKQDNEHTAHYDEIKCYQIQQSDLRDIEGESSNMHSSRSREHSHDSSGSPVFDDYREEGGGYGATSIASSSSCTSLDQFPEEKIVYLDDIDIEPTGNEVDLCESLRHGEGVYDFVDFVTMGQQDRSCSSQHLSHVHPKLPDCDDIAAKFMALKKASSQNKDRRRTHHLQ